MSERAELGSNIQQDCKQSTGRGMVISKMANKTFFPTPSNLAGKMIGKIKGEPIKILEPSAGKGDLIEYLEKRYRYTHHHIGVSAIEIDEELQATLRARA